jgi:two-component system OmpR family sensor kinase
VRNIALSLVLITFTGLIGLGWGLDWLYSHYIKVDQISDTSPYENIGRQLANSIDSLPDYKAYINDWNKGGFSQISLVVPEEFSMPDSLLIKLQSGDPLVLQTPDDLVIYYYLPKHDLIMLFTPTDLQVFVHRRSGSGLLTLTFYAGVLILLLLWLYPLVSRLAMINRLTQQLGRGDLSVRMPPAILSYTQTIENEFNRMAASIENLVADNKLLSSAVSHDLRTPLSRIRFGVDTLSETQEQSEKDEYIEHLNKDIDEMESLIEVLLSYSKMINNNIVVEKMPLDFACLVSDCVAQTYDANSRLSYVEPSEVISIVGLGRHLIMMINNLIQNAIVYGKFHVQISVTNDNSWAALVIEDDGPGIPQKDRIQVLKPFVRGRQAEGVNEGHGMGLAIVDRVAQLHNGSVTVGDSIVLGGAMITVKLPLE